MCENSNIALVSLCFGRVKYRIFVGVAVLSFQIGIADLQFRQAPFGQIAPHSGDRSPPAALFHDEESGHHGGDAVVAEETRRKIRLFAFISTTSKYAKKRAAYIKATWARRIEGFLFLSNQDDPSIPAIKTVSNDQMQFQVIDGLLFSYRYNLSDFDYFIKTEDDAYIIPENLRFLLRGFDPSDRIMVGHTPQPNDVKTNMSDHDPNGYSDHSALFQHVPEEEMYVLEYLVYHAYPYGVFRDPGVYSRALQILSEALPKKV
nr:unnamed protein product [Spirometra erinaceieuropaei]